MQIIEQGNITFYPGMPFSPASLLNNAVSNIICRLVFGKRFDYSDHDFQNLLKNLSEALQLEGSIWGQVRKCPSNFISLHRALLSKQWVGTHLWVTNQYLWVLHLFYFFN